MNSWKPCAFLIVSAFVLGMTQPVHGQATDAASFISLREKVAELRFQLFADRVAALDKWTEGLVECPRTVKPPPGGYLQYIYNRVYSWAVVPVGAGYCVYMFEPPRRPLAADEARDLLQASQMEFPVPQSAKRAPAPEIRALPGGDMPRISFPPEPAPSGR